MSILIVDDSKSSQLLLQGRLKKAGFNNFVVASSAKESFELLGMGSPEVASNSIDLILMDNIMPEIDGIEATRRIKEVEALRDIPIIMVTASEEIDTLQSAFDAGVVDFLKKPFNKVELIARIKSALELKDERDKRKEAIRKLRLLSSLDGLTGIANRRHFDDFLDREWRRSVRDGTPLSLILMDIDFFKKYNDGYGHQAGDDCLKKVAKKLNEIVHRPGDLVARYGGEEFVVVLGSTDIKTATVLAEKVRAGVEDLRIAHEFRAGGSVVTLSIGVSCVIPKTDLLSLDLIKTADKSLYKAKEEGRNKVVVADF